MTDSEDDRLDPEDLAFVGLIADVVRQSVVDDLLAGSDVQCFTTEQYRARYEASKWRSGLVPVSLDLARQHLRSLRGVVREVRADVWAACQEEVTP